MRALRMRDLAALESLVPAAYLSYNEANLARRRSILGRPAEAFFPEGMPILNAYFHQHPVEVYHRRHHDGCALKSSDLLTAWQYHVLALYREFSRLVGSEDQMSIMLFVRPTRAIAIAGNRTRRTCGERDRPCLDVLRPHLVQAYRNALAFQRVHRLVAMLAQGLEPLHASMLFVAANGRVQAVSERLWQWLGAYVDLPACRLGRLPEFLAR